MSTDLATREQAGAPARITTISDVFRSTAFKQQVAMALPRHISADSMMRIALTQVRLTPKLDECSVESFMGALLQAAQLGLRPGILGEGYLIPRWNGRKRCQEACFQPGYQGIAQLAFRSGEITEAYAEAVYRSDTFSYQKGDEAKIVHLPDPDNEPDESKITYFYAVVKLKNGGILREVMTRKQVDVVRDRYAQRDRESGQIRKDSTWVTDYTVMGRKTALLRALKLAPKSTELQMAIEASFEADAMGGQVANAVSASASATAADRVAAKLGVAEQQQPQEQPAPQQDEQPIQTDSNGEVIDQEGDDFDDAFDGLEAPPWENTQDETTPDPAPETQQPLLDQITDPQMRKIAAVIKENGIDVAQAKAWMLGMFGVESRKALSKKQASEYIEYLLKQGAAA